MVRNNGYGPMGTFAGILARQTPMWTRALRGQTCISPYGGVQLKLIGTITFGPVKTTGGGPGVEWQQLMKGHTKQGKVGSLITTRPADIFLRITAYRNARRRARDTPRTPSRSSGESMWWCLSLRSRALADPSAHTHLSAPATSFKHHTWHMRPYRALRYGVFRRGFCQPACRSFDATNRDQLRHEVPPGRCHALSWRSTCCIRYGGRN